MPLETTSKLLSHTHDISTPVKKKTGRTTAAQPRPRGANKGTPKKSTAVPTRTTKITKRISNNANPPPSYTKSTSYSKPAHTFSSSKPHFQTPLPVAKKIPIFCCPTIKYDPEHSSFITDFHRTLVKSLLDELKAATLPPTPTTIPRSPSFVPFKFTYAIEITTREPAPLGFNFMAGGRMLADEKPYRWFVLMDENAWHEEAAEEARLAKIEEEESILGGNSDNKADTEADTIMDDESAAKTLLELRHLDPDRLTASFGFAGGWTGNLFERGLNTAKNEKENIRQGEDARLRPDGSSHIPRRRSTTFATPNNRAKSTTPIKPRPTKRTPTPARSSPILRREKDKRKWVEISVDELPVNFGSTPSKHSFDLKFICEKGTDTGVHGKEWTFSVLERNSHAKAEQEKQQQQRLTMSGRVVRKPRMIQPTLLAREDKDEDGVEGDGEEEEVSWDESDAEEREMEESERIGAEEDKGLEDNGRKSTKKRRRNSSDDEWKP